MTNDNDIKLSKAEQALENARSARLEVLSKHLCESLEPRAAIWTPIKRFLICLAAFGAYMALLAVVMPLRFPKMAEALFQVDIILSWGTGLSALYAALMLMVPTEPKELWKRVTLPLIIAILFGLWTFGRVYPEFSAEGHLDLAYSFHGCFWYGLLFIVFPMVIIVQLAQRSASTAPKWLHVMSLLAVSGFGWGFLRLSCGIDEPAHAFIFHFMPYFVIGVITSFMSRFLFRSI